MQRTAVKNESIISVGPPLYLPTAGGWPREIGGRVYPEQRGSNSSAYLEVGTSLAARTHPPPHGGGMLHAHISCAAMTD